MPTDATTIGKMLQAKPVNSSKTQFHNFDYRRNLVLDSYIPIMPCLFLFIPEGVSIMTVIIDGVDVAPAGVVRRSSCSRERWSCPADIRIRAPGGS